MPRVTTFTHCQRDINSVKQSLKRININIKQKRTVYLYFVWPPDVCLKLQFAMQFCVLICGY